MVHVAERVTVPHLMSASIRDILYHQSQSRRSQVFASTYRSTHISSSTTTPSSSTATSNPPILQRLGPRINRRPSSSRTTSSTRLCARRPARTRTSSTPHPASPSSRRIRILRRFLSSPRLFFLPPLLLFPSPLLFLLSSLSLPLQFLNFVFRICDVCAGAFPCRIED